MNKTEITLALAFTATYFIEYSKLEGQREGYHYYFKSLSGLIDANFKEHKLFTLQRGTVAILIMLGLISLWLFKVIPAIIALSFFAALWMHFPFIHDYNYYQTRNKLTPGVYPYGVNSQSKDSQSVIDHAQIGKKNISTPGTRLVLFIAGQVIILIDLIYIILK